MVYTLAHSYRRSTMECGSHKPLLFIRELVLMNKF